ncbi:hypothetical protein DM01DRAFT_1403482 [Hesseltinella vesiculosa]|uniref:Uncharacterized protein n=1 Tax=Hesseltinella vesiculosa TaxID=101127 RepID=A0A1X2GYE6_9FUNG|nr:hypothetical protein DM01DRAFT_1403482 [Hesseltinella vesiculosa]
MKRQRKSLDQRRGCADVFSDIEDDDDDDFWHAQDQKSISKTSVSATPTTAREPSPIDVFSDDDDPFDTGPTMSRHSIQAWSNVVAQPVDEIARFEDVDDAPTQKSSQHSDFLSLASPEASPVLSPQNQPGGRTLQIQRALSASASPTKSIPAFEFSKHTPSSSKPAPDSSLSLANSYKAGGLAQAAARQIEKEFLAFKTWHTTVKSHLVSQGLAKYCIDYDQGRLCRILELWVEQGQWLAWCVDLTDHEKAFLSRSSFPSLGPSLSSPGTQNSQTTKDTVSDFSQPASLPDYEPNDSDHPYLCLFSFVHMPSVQRLQANLARADYIGLWPPWSSIPITINHQEHHVHVVTRFMLEEAF